MRIHEVVGGQPITLSLRPEDAGWSTPPAQNVELQLVWSNNKVLTTIGNEAVALTGATAADTTQVTDLLAGGLPFLCYVAKADKKRLVLEARRFPRELNIADPAELGLDDRVMAALEKSHRVSGTVTDVSNWLMDRLFMPPRQGAPDDARRLVVATGRDDELNSFRIFGHKLSADVRRFGDRLRIERVVRGARIGKRRLTLLHWPVRIVDATQSAALSSAARTALDEAVADGASYLRIWREYYTLELRQVIRRAREFGFMEYNKCSRLPEGGWRFQLIEVDDWRERLRALGDIDRFELVATDSVEVYPDDDDVENWTRPRSDPRLSAGIARIDESKRIIELAPVDDEDVPIPPPRGYLALSIIGDEVRLKRRKAAEEALRTGNCPLPQLGLLMEGRPAPAARMPKRRALTPSVRELFGSSRPTERQTEAIERALNTPDICLIQGPPGTGKTKVITALEHRLAELADEGKELSHRILVSAAQHDAVDNVAQRTQVFGLPAAKVGRRRGSGRGAVDLVQAFADDRADALRALSPDPPDAERLSKARSLVIAACRVPARRAELARRLVEIVQTLEGLITPALKDEVVTQASALRRPGSSGEPEQIALQLKAARGIRIETGPFLDDGPRRAMKALRRLETVLQDDERAFLERCAALDAEQVPDWLSEGRPLRDRLVDRLTQPAETEVPTLDESTQALLLKVLEDVEHRIEQGRAGEEATIAAFLHDLEHDPAEVRRALEHYTVVLASTLQHAASKGMRNVRKVRIGSVTFESVIVDEAARANPLDLFIPLSMAKRRVVLVGDHRQLPHLLEPDVERELREGVDDGSVREQTLKAIQASLFERLWVVLRQLEAQDGIRRTVTLDAQYRMHPALGDYVSKAFYEPNGDGPIESPRPASDFDHDLPGYAEGGTPRAAAWLDVPAGRGKEVRGTSKSRPAEARAIAKEVRRLIDHDPSLTFGVIAFYRAQVDQIGREMLAVGLAEKAGDGWRVAERWATTRDSDDQLVERLRVGTVDAFQGKEFDVVFLSVTRSNDLPGETIEEQRRKYGHLMLDNRLCVAMSRQKRLLVVTGDRRFVEEAVPLAPLHAYIDACRGENGVLR